MTSARVQENDLGNVDTAIAPLSQGPRDRSAQPRRGGVARAAVPRDRALPGALHHPAAKVGDPRGAARQEGRALPGRRHRGGRPQPVRGRHRRLQQGARDRLRRLRAIDALIRRYLDLSRWQDLLGVYAKKADLVADVDEKKGIYYQVGAVYERELGDVPRAIDTYTKILELDPDDLQALSRLDVLYEQAQNWTELLSVLTRESEMTGDPNEAISFQYRIAELYEKHLDDVPRAVELYREILQRQPDHEPDAARPRGPEGRRQGPARRRRRPRAGLRGDERLAQAHQRPRGPGPSRRPTHSRRWSCCTASRVSTRTRSATTRRRSTRTRARCPLDDGNEQTLGNLERLAMVVNRWPEVAKLYDAQLDKLARGRHTERFVELGLRNAQIFEVQLEDVDGAIARYRRVVDADAGEPDRDPRARPALRADRALGGARGDPRARGRDRAVARTRSSSSSTASARCEQTRLGEPRRGDRGVPRRHQRGAGAPGDARGARGASSRAARSRRRSARSSSPSTAR